MAMKITLRLSGKASCELQVGTTHHPHPGPLPQVGDTLVIPDDADVPQEAKGRVRVRRIVWHYSPASTTLWPEIVCRPA